MQKSCDEISVKSFYFHPFHVRWWCHLKSCSCEGRNEMSLKPWIPSSLSTHSNYNQCASSSPLRPDWQHIHHFSDVTFVLILIGSTFIIFLTSLLSLSMLHKGEALFPLPHSFLLSPTPFSLLWQLLFYPFPHSCSLLFWFSLSV